MHLLTHYHECAKQVRRQKDIMLHRTSVNGKQTPRQMARRATPKKHETIRLILLAEV